MKESKIKKIHIYKERDYNGILGNIQFWEESDENLETRISTKNTWDFTEQTQGQFIGELRLNSKFMTPKMSKKFVKLLKEAFKDIPNPKVKINYIMN